MMALAAGRRTLMRQAILIGAAALAIGCQATPVVSADVASDFKFQGEYLGKVAPDSLGLGAQVVAKGNGAFAIAFLPGGLPGKGWDTTTRADQAGAQQADGVLFPASDPAKQYTAAISADGLTLSGKTPKGESFTLNKAARQSPTLGAAPPAGSAAIVLFDGKDLSAFAPGSAVLDSGLLLPTGSASSGAVTLRTFGSFTLHLEFRVPFMPTSSEQGRGNSGVYLQGRYELQILDSFGLNILRNGEGPATQECGAFFQLVRPRLNMSLPPLAWQTYDIEFTKAKFDAPGTTVLEPAMVTIRLNGELIHDRQKLVNQTLLGDAVGPTPGPLRFQAHGDPVHYRNIWVVENEGTSLPPAPRAAPARIRTGLRHGDFAPGLSLVSGRRASGPLSSGYYLSTERASLLMP